VAKDGAKTTTTVKINPKTWIIRESTQRVTIPAATIMRASVSLNVLAPDGSVPKPAP